MSAKHNEALAQLAVIRKAVRSSASEVSRLYVLMSILEVHQLTIIWYGYSIDALYAPNMQVECICVGQHCSFGMLK